MSSTKRAALRRYEPVSIQINFKNIHYTCDTILNLNTAWIFHDIEELLLMFLRHYSGILAMLKKVPLSF